MVAKSAKKNVKKASQPKWLKEGLAFEAKGDIVGAENVYKAELQKDPNHYDAMCAWTDLACKARKYEAAMMMANQAMKMAPERPEALVLLGISLYMQGKNEQARTCFKRAEELDENNVRALYYLALMAKENDRNKEKALEFAQQAYAICDDMPELLNLLGNLYAEANKHDKSEDMFKRILALGVRDVVVYCNYADILVKMGRDQDALQQYQMAEALQPNNVMALEKLSELYHKLNCIDEAYACDQKVLEQNPQSLESLRKIISYWVKKDNLEAVQACVDELIRVAPNDPSNYSALVSAKKVTSADAAYIEKMEKLIELPQQTQKAKEVLGYALGKAYNDLKEYDKAFSYYEIGARNHETNIKREAELFDYMVQWLKKNITPEFYEARKGYGWQGKENPIFIVGTPRSGTTLVEQIISSHSKVKAAGELRFVGEVIGELGSGVDVNSDAGVDNSAYPAGMLRYDEKAIAGAAQQYLDKVKRSYGLEGMFTDKMPANTTHLGMIALMFPNAKIIHCCRHPLDACLSMYFQNFSTGHDYSFSLDGLVVMYRQYVEMMKLWKKILPIEIYDICYEQLLDTPEEKVKGLIEHCGLDWEASCLEFYKSDRAIATASHAQVKQPLYKTSKQRWRKYESHIQPLIEGLRDEVGAYEAKWMGK